MIQYPEKLADQMTNLAEVIGKAMKSLRSSISNVGFTGEYSDLLNAPSKEQFGEMTACPEDPVKLFESAYRGEKLNG